MFGFEEDVHALLPFCEIHIFDHTVENPTAPKFTTFHKIGLGPVDGGDFLTLESIKARLGHSDDSIEILKIDCEGCESDVIFKTMPSWTNVRQVLIEIHWQGENSPYDILSFFHDTFVNDWAMFSKEPNYQWASGEAIEFGFIKLDWGGAELQRRAEEEWCVSGWSSSSPSVPRNAYVPANIATCAQWGPRK